MENETLLNDLKRNIILGHLDETDEGFDGDMEGKPGASELAMESIGKKVPAGRILETVSEAMDEVGRKYDTGEYLISDMLASAECAGTVMESWEPHLAAGDLANKEKFVLATVKGDLHDIGKNIVATMLKGAGYDVKDLGINVEIPDILNAVKEHNARYLGLSALLTTTMTEMEKVVQALKDAGIRNQVKVFIGGAPTSEEFARQIGADHYCPDAFNLIEILKKTA